MRVRIWRAWVVRKVYWGRVALSTALLVLGPEAGAELAERQGLAAFFLTRRTGRLATLSTPEFERHVVR